MDLPRPWRSRPDDHRDAAPEYAGIRAEDSSAGGCGRGHDPVMQVTCRDRNRLAIQSDLLSAHILGIRNILCLTGDYPTVGDHKDAKPVYDLDSVGVMQMIQVLNQGKDLAGHKLQGPTEIGRAHV